MTPNLLSPNVWVALGVLIATGPVFARTHSAKPTLTIRMYDYVNLPPHSRSEITSNAKRVLGQAGVLVAFVECYSGGVAPATPDCSAPLGLSELILRIFEPKLAAKGEQLGYAAMTPEGGAYITVFVNPAQRRATARGLSDGSFLGHAVAHEIGHLLLGTNSHSSSGVMRPVWRDRDEEWMAKGVLLFTPVQARQMRSALTERSSR